MRRHMFGSGLKQGWQNDFCAHWFFDTAVDTVDFVAWLEKASSLKFSHLQTKYVLLTLSVSPAVLDISTFSVGVVISLLYPVRVWVCEVSVQLSVCRIKLCHISVHSFYCTNFFLSSALLSLPLFLCVHLCVCARRWLLQKVLDDVTVDCNAGSHVCLWTQLLLLINISISSPLLSCFQLCRCCYWHQMQCVCVCARIWEKDEIKSEHHLWNWCCKGLQEMFYYFIYISFFKYEHYTLIHIRWKVQDASGDTRTNWHQCPAILCVCVCVFVCFTSSATYQLWCTL